MKWKGCHWVKYLCSILLDSLTCFTTLITGLDHYILSLYTHFPAHAHIRPPPSSPSPSPSPLSPFPQEITRSTARIDGPCRILSLLFSPESHVPQRTKLDACPARRTTQRARGWRMGWENPPVSPRHPGASRPLLPRLHPLSRVLPLPLLSPQWWSGGPRTLLPRHLLLR